MKNNTIREYYKREAKSKTPKNEINDEKKIIKQEPIAKTITRKRKQKSTTISLKIHKIHEYRQESLKRAQNLVETAIKNNEITKKTIDDASIRKQLQFSSPKIEEEVKPITKEPAFKRFKHLTTDVKDTEKKLEFTKELILPGKFQDLFVLFQSVDSILYLLYLRKAPCSLFQLQRHVNKSIEKTLKKSDISKMVTVAPSFFKFHLNKNPSGINKLLHEDVASFIKTKSILMVEPNYQEALEQLSVSFSPILSKSQLQDEFQIELSPLKRRLFGQSPKKTSSIYQSPIKQQISNFKTPEPKKPSITVKSCHLSWRKDTFYQKLVQITQNHHIRFLKEINIEIPSNKLIRRWHPKFCIDTIPDIEEALLPGDEQQGKIYTFKDILDDKSLEIKEKIKKVLENKEKVVDTKSNVTNDKNLRSISPNLLERIRLKEKMMNVEKMVLNEDDKELREKKAISQRLPELLNIMYTHLRGEGKSCITVEKAIKKLMDSSTYTISMESMSNHLKELSENLPDFVNIIKVGKTMFLKFSFLKMTLKDAMDILDEKIKSL